jgi:ribosomal protein S14
LANSAEGQTPVREPARLGGVTPRTLPGVLATDAKPDRLIEVRNAYHEAMGRLSKLCPIGMGDAWGEISARPDWVRDIEIAEAAADREALAYQRGTTSKPFLFLTALAAWELAWADALAATVRAPEVCADCGRKNATIVVTTQTGRFCRKCLRG